MKKILFSDPKTQYVAGVILNISFLFLLYTFDISYSNVQIPKGKYQNNIWQCSDVNSYIDPAQNFIDYRVFGKKLIPDNFRTIGYPALISFFIWSFNDHWLLCLQIFQAIIFALIYPLVTHTIKIILPDTNKRYISLVFLLLCFSGTYFTRTAFILTDTLFTLLWIAGFYYGLKTYITNKISHLIFYLLFVTLAALVRPILSLFPILNIAMGFWIAKKYNYSFNKIFIKSLYLSLAIFALINISTLRNYINYSFVSPSSVAGINASDYLTKKVLEKEGKSDLYQFYSQNIFSESDISVKTKLRKECMFTTIMQYPVSTIYVLFENSINVFLSNNLISNIARYFDYDWKNYKSSCHRFKTNKILYYATYFMMFIYGILWLLFAFQIVRMVKLADYSTLLIILLLFTMIITPGVLTGGGGSRFRLPFEQILVMGGMYVFFNKSGTQKPIGGN